MPTLAMETKENINAWAKMSNSEESSYNLIDNFMQLLDKKIYEAKDMLIERFDYICSQDPSSATFMWENNTMLGYKPGEGIKSALKHGTLALG